MTRLDRNTICWDGGVNCWELAAVRNEREDNVLSGNEIAKLEIASELHRQGVAVETIARMLGIAKETVLDRVDSSGPDQ